MILRPGSVSAVCVYRRKSLLLTAYLTQEVSYAPNHDP